MNRLTSYIIGVLLAVPFMSQGQTATEAFRLSESDPAGTARNLGTGNSMFAIGPDFSAIGLNPSGLGGYGKSEFLLSLGMNFNNTKASFSSDPGNELQENGARFNLPNVGFVIHNRPASSTWNTSNWAIGFNKTADYNRDLTYEGFTTGSITDAWRENATGFIPDDQNGFEEGLAYEAGAIYDFEDDNIYETDYNLNSQYALFKRESSVISGGKSELFLAYGADWNRKVMFGISVGLPIVNSTETRNYRETDGDDDGIPFFNGLHYFNTINSTGYGWNAKIGVTVKPAPFINIALAFHTPTRLRMTDNFNSTLSYDFTDDNNDGPIKAESPFGSFEYALRTPWSASGGIGIIAGKSGFIAAHAKYTDYSSMKYRYDVRGNGDRFDQLERQVNNEIKASYGSALQLNIGGEFVLDYFRLRGGVSMLQSAFNNDNTFDPAYHAGVGYRGDNFYVDLGYKISSGDEGYLPYATEVAPQPLVLAETVQHQLAATVGFKF